MDTDFHNIFDIDKNKINEDKEICIGNNVWIGTRNTILKGSNLKNNIVVGAGSLIQKEFEESNVVIAGNPAKGLKKNIAWDK